MANKYCDTPYHTDMHTHTLTPSHTHTHIHVCTYPHTHTPSHAHTHSLNPSRTCGPFRGKQFMFNIVTDLVDEASCTWQQVLDFLASTGFVIPIFISLM